MIQVRGESVYLLEVVRKRFEYPDLHRRVIELHRKWARFCNSYSLLIENKGSGMGLVQHSKREHIHAIPVNPVGDKAMRMNNQTARIEFREASCCRGAPFGSTNSDASSADSREGGIMIRWTRFRKRSAARLSRVVELPPLPRSAATDLKFGPRSAINILGPALTIGSSTREDKIFVLQRSSAPTVTRSDSYAVA